LPNTVQFAQTESLSGTLENQKRNYFSFARHFAVNCINVDDDSMKLRRKGLDECPEGNRLKSADNLNMTGMEQVNYQ